MNAVHFCFQKLLEEIEKNKEKCDECHNYAKAYIDTIKVNATCIIGPFPRRALFLCILTNFCLFQDYELQLVAYKAQVEPLTSPLKKTKMESASDNIIQEVSTFSVICSLWLTSLCLKKMFSKSLVYMHTLNLITNVFSPPWLVCNTENSL